MRLLKFTLAGPLQSWGENSPWDYRQTESIPTKSAIVGMISACFGYKRDDPRIAKLSQSINVAIRVDKPGILMEDFQVVKTENGLVGGDGKRRKGANGEFISTIILHKYYLQDARFTVFLEAKKDVLKSIYDAMKQPVHLVYLGRKSCVPSIPVLPEYIDSQDLETAVIDLTEKEKEIIQTNKVLVEIESTNPPKTPLSRVKTILRRDSIVNAKSHEMNLRKTYRFYINN